MKEYFDELVFWVTVFIAAAFFIIPIRAFMKVAVARWAPAGLQEAIAS